MAFTASQFLTKFTTISAATTAATIGGYIPAASTAAQIYSFSIANVATSNKRAYADVFFNDGAGNVVNFVRQLPIDPGAAKALNNVSKHIITSSGYMSAAITSTAAPIAVIMSLVEII